MKLAFYIFGTTNFQDMFPIIFSALKRGDDCWVSFYDIFNAKRQLYNYTLEEVESFFKEKCENLNLKMPDITFFRNSDIAYANRKYDDFRPDLIFAQEIKPKSTSWYPAVSAPVVHLAWWDESHHLRDNKYLTPVISILKQEEDKKFYKEYKTAYFGDLRLEHLLYSRPKETDIKSCFIPETYMRINSEYEEFNKELVRFYDKLFFFLKSRNIKIIWKKREKGFPKGKWASPLDYTSAQPDKIIEKDLKFPSSLVEEAYNADFCLVIDDSFAYFDIMNVNSNCYILSVNKKRQYKIDQFFLEYKDKIINMKTDGAWDKIDEICKLKNQFFGKVSIENKPSFKILEYCDEILKNE